MDRYIFTNEIEVTILSFILCGKIRIFFTVVHIFVVKGLKYAPLARKSVSTIPRRSL